MSPRRGAMPSPRALKAVPGRAQRRHRGQRKGVAIVELPDLLNLNVRRDLVFIERRGTGESNPLNCLAFPA